MEELNGDISLKQKDDSLSSIMPWHDAHSKIDPDARFANAIV